MQEKLKVLSTKELKEKWDNFSDEYSKNVEVTSIKAGKRFFATITTLMKELKMESKQNLNFGEIACGSGLFIEHVISIYPQSYLNIDLFDLSKYMISKTKLRLDKLSGYYPIALKENDFSNKSFNIRVFNQNAENLYQIPSDHYDILIGNLVIHLVEKPECIIKEIERVVKPNGIGFFSVLSDFENSSVFNSVFNIVKKYGYKSSNTRSIFYLENDNDLRNLFKSDKLKVMKIETKNIQFEDARNGMFNISLNNYVEFINELPKYKLKELYEEYEVMMNQYIKNEKTLNYNVKAIFYQKIE